MKYGLIGLLAICATLPISAQGEEKKEEGSHAAKAVWYADFDKAVEAAKKEKKDILVDFTGSDWCGWCIKLHKEVFDHEEFDKGVTKSYILCALDFPQAPEVKAKVPNPQRNEELQGKYNIQGFPTILLMNADGEVFGKTGYQPGGPEAYVKHLDEIATKGKAAVATAKEMQKSYASAKPEEKMAMIEKAIATLSGAEEELPGQSIFIDIVKDALKLDADNKAGLKLKAIECLLKTGSADAAVVAEAKKLDPKNEKGLFEKCVEMEMGKISSKEGVIACLKSIEELDKLGEIKNKDFAKMAYANATFWSLRVLEDKAAAKAWSEKLKKIAGDDPRFTKLFEMLEEGGEKKEDGDN